MRESRLAVAGKLRELCVKHWVLLRIPVMMGARVFGDIHGRTKAEGVPCIAGRLGIAVDLLFRVIQAHIVRGERGCKESERTSQSVGGLIRSGSGGIKRHVIDIVAKGRGRVQSVGNAEEGFKNAVGEPAAGNKAMVAGAVRLIVP